MNGFMNYDFGIKKIVLACFVPSGTGSAVHTNRPSHGLAINLHGEKEYIFSSGTKITIKENDIIYLPQYSNYTVFSKIHGDCYAINFELSEDINFPPFDMNIKNYGKVIDNFRSATKAWYLKKNGYMTKCKAELYNIIYSMQQEYFTDYLPKKKLDIIKPGIDYIHANYSKEMISIDFISALCNITPEYFRKIFKSFYGISPVKYINNLKISRAKELLASRMFSVSEAAFQSGYSEMSYFSREFKKAEGVSPSDFLK